ncbi:class I SAM-dependent methyltransferase [Streptococcus gallinaceus]|uniref:SAM-dependent methyltransferase n=1 Tax=Streptococcus gallinaceus TaxID=165758 RepID=A0ABV2JKJ5_9STRE
MKAYIITTSFNPDQKQVTFAQHLADQYGFTYKERRKESVKKLMADGEGALIVYREKLIFVAYNGRELIFHPDTAMLRIKALHDPLVDVMGENPKEVLDCTMGLASDSLVMAVAGHKVTAIESQLIPYLVVSQGLQTHISGHAKLDAAMRSIQAIRADYQHFLSLQASDSFDVLYFDPMFSERIAASDNLAGLESVANPTRLTAAVLEEAKRVAREKIIIKAYFRDTVFEELGFERMVRPNQKFHYGVIELAPSK